MSYQDEIIAFLAQPENLAIALEVADYVQELRKKQHKMFWELFTRRIQDQLAGSSFHHQWRFQPLPNDKWSTQLGKCYLVPAQAVESDKPLLQYAIGQGNSNNFYQLYRGVCWITEAPKGSYHQIEELEFTLKEKGLTKTDKNWPGYNWMPYRIQSNKFIKQFYENPEKTIDLVVGDLWQLFEDLHPLLEQINSRVGS